MSLLEVRDLKVHFAAGGGLLRQGGGVVHAVDGVSFAVDAGEVVALVGESGCGKTTVARTIVGLQRPTAGEVFVDGRAAALTLADDRIGYRRQVQMVFQDPFDSLNPRKTVLQTLAQPLRTHRVARLRTDVRAEAVRLLDTVGLSPGATFLDRYPHEFSGGQRQRIGIARALAPGPRLVVADEAVSALDISIRAQVLGLLQRLQRELELSYLFITHDLGVVRSLADRVIVMYLGQIVESGPTDQIFTAPRHPYTAALLDASPIPDPVRARRSATRVLGGDVPSPVDPPAGCRFRSRCPMAQDVCAEPPPWKVFPAARGSLCHFAEQVSRTLGADAPPAEVS